MVASYSNCAMAQRPIYPGDKIKKVNHNNQKNSMVTSVTSSGKSSTSPLSEGEGKVSGLFFYLLFSRKICLIEEIFYYYFYFPNDSVCLLVIAI